MIVGDGILQAMAQRGDWGLRDSEFVTNSDGSSYERGLGTLGYYHASNSTGEWVVVLEPFEVPGPIEADDAQVDIPHVDLRGKLPVRAGAEPYRHRDLTKVDLYCVHYSASQGGITPYDIARYQTGATAHLPFPAIAYHLVVDQQGTLYLCHEFSVRTWGSGGPGVNARAIHACYTGDREPTGEQMRGLLEGRLLSERQLGRALTVEGHKDRDQTMCPGPTWPAWRPVLLPRYF